MLNERQEQLLKLIIESYVESAEPIGSNFLVASSGLELSGATVRNEMRELEEAGYLTHPHTSAGRIPTEAGYRYYIQHLMKPVTIKKKFQQNMEQAVSQKNDNHTKQKELGRLVAGFTEHAVIVSLDHDRVFYTGLTQLFSQPEFDDVAVTRNISAVLDNCEELMQKLYNVVTPDETRILIGAENPMGDNYSTVVSRAGKDGLFVVLGPLRMDYGEHVAIMDFIRKIF